jgi:predicted TIM-barrel fold metal-dependent hydrolase
MKADVDRGAQAGAPTPAHAPASGSAPAATPYPGAVDCHAHVFGPASRFAYAPERKYTPPDASAHAHLSMLDGLGMARGVLVQGSAHGLDNSALLDAVSMAPHRLRGIAVIPAGTSEECLHDLRRRNIVGLRVFSDADKRYGGSVSLAAACGMIPALQRTGMQVQLLAPLAEIDEASVRRLAAAQIPLVIDHFGYVDTQAGTEHWLFARLCDWLASGLVWVKLSAAYRLCGAGDSAGAGSDSTAGHLVASSGSAAGSHAARPFHQALLAANASGLLWGSDWPHPNHDGAAPQARRLLDQFLDWTPDPAVRRRILVDNPVSLFMF